MHCRECGKAKNNRVIIRSGKKYYACEDGHAMLPVADVLALKRPTARKGSGRGKKR